jgi:hypothetical protein
MSKIILNFIVANIINLKAASKFQFKMEKLCHQLDLVPLNGGVKGVAFRHFPSGLKIINP